MSSLKAFLTNAFAISLLMSPAFADDIGRPASPEEISLWDIDVRPDGKGLPKGAGSVSQGKAIYDDNCAACHGAMGQDGIKDRLVGGQGTLTSDRPIKTVGSYWPYATTLFDYIRRAMPYQAPGSLTNDEVYAVSAYILSLNRVIPSNVRLDQSSLPKVRMPNRDGFFSDPEFQSITNSRQAH